MKLLLPPKFSTVFGGQLGVMKTVPWSWVSKVFIDRDMPSVFTVRWNHQCSTFLPTMMAFMAESNAWLLGQRAANGLWGLNQQSLSPVHSLTLRGWQTDPRSNELQARDSGWVWMFNSDLHSGNENEAEKCQEHTKHLLSMHFLLQLFRYSFNQAVIAVGKLSQGHLSTIMQTLITLTVSKEHHVVLKQNFRIENMLPQWDFSTSKPHFIKKVLCWNIRIHRTWGQSPHELFESLSSDTSSSMHSPWLVYLWGWWTYCLLRKSSSKLNSTSW